MKTIAGNSCVVHGYHYPRPLRTVSHHMWPQELGGPDTPENLVWVCDTGHYNIHELINAYRYKRTPLNKGTRKEQLIAQVAIDHLKGMGK